MDVIAAAPNTERFGTWNGPFPGWDVATYLNRAAAEEPGTVPMLATYRIVDGHCGHWSDPAHTGYRNVDAFAWIANPGVSSGECQPGAPPSGVFWPGLALQLVQHANFHVR